MSSTADWRSWRAWLADGTPGSPNLSRRLDALAEPIGNLLGPGRDDWGALGVELIEAPLSTSGGCQDFRGRRRIFVHEKDNPSRKRFTAVHELGHLLLMDERIAASGELSPAREERLCDSFASAVLVPRDRLAAILRSYGLPRHPGELLSLCRAFGVNITPMMIALRPYLSSVPWTIVPSRRRGHRDRPGPVDFRVECFAGNRRVFLPPEQRLISLGLSSLVTWARASNRGATATGVDDTWLNRDLNGQEAEAPTVRWTAQHLGGEPDLVLAVLQLAPVLKASAARLDSASPRDARPSLAVA